MERFPVVDERLGVARIVGQSPAMRGAVSLNYQALVIRGNQLCQLFKPCRVSPALPKSARTQGNEDSDSQHQRIALGFRGGLIDESADTGILVVNEVTKVRSFLVSSLVDK